MQCYSSPEKDAEVTKQFKYHPPKEGQLLRYTELRKLGKHLARTMINFCPPSRETSLALTNLQQAIMWANSAIAIHESEETQEIKDV